MTRPGSTRRLPLLIVVGLTAAALLFGCESEDEPVFDNPLDPANPGAADPFGLTAVYADGQVVLEWTVPAGPAIARIVVEQLVAGQPTDLDTVAIDVTTYTDTAPRGNAENQYRLRAEDADGRAAATSQVVAASVFVPPVIDIPDAVPETSGGVTINRARHDILVRAVNGDVVQIDTLGDFSTTQPVPLVDGVGTYEDFHLRKPRLENGTPLSRRDLYVRAGILPDGGGDPQWPGAPDTLLVNMELVTGISRRGGGDRLAGPFVDVALLSAGEGADSVRFATSEEDLADAPWLPPAATYEDVPVRDTPLPQNLYAQFLSSFGDVQTSDALQLRGDDLGGASFSLDLPESGIVEGRDVDILSSAIATGMRVSTSVGFEGGTGWIDYADTLTYTFAADDPGPQTLYVQYRNHWYISPVLLEQVQLSAVVLDPTFTTPLDGDPVRGGSTVEVAGTVGGLGETFELSRVEVNLGDGWQDLAADTLWATTWTAPGFDADTEWPLGVRATASDTESDVVIEGVAWIEVVITQLTIAITSPADGEEVATGALVTISGQATQDLTSAPLDSIRVTVADTAITTTESLTGWSVGWDAAAVADTTETTITATVYADTDSLSDSVMVTLVPPEPEEEEE